MGSLRSSCCVTKPHSSRLSAQIDSFAEPTFTEHMWRKKSIKSHEQIPCRNQPKAVKICCNWKEIIELIATAHLRASLTVIGEDRFSQTVD